MTDHKENGKHCHDHKHDHEHKKGHCHDDHPHGKCKCVCHNMNGLFIAAIGVVLLLSNLEIITAQVTHIAWPSLLILIGLKKSFGRGQCKCCSHS